MTLWQCPTNSFPHQKILYETLHCSLDSIHRAALWILGEYCTSVEDISRVVQEIRVALGEVPDHMTVM